MDMPRVAKCDVNECAYNVSQMCHALAITVGDSTNPLCDTFLPSATKGGDKNAIAGVGACKVSICRHNSKLECNAPSVHVGYQQNNVDCLTFEPR